MRVEAITSADDPRVSVYQNVRDRDLMARDGLFMAEGRFVVRMLVDPVSRFRAHSVLVTEAARESLADALAGVGDDVAVYVASQGVMDAIVGFHIHRGCLAAAHRGAAQDVAGLIGGAATATHACVVVLEDIANHDNVGAVFRSAAAFGVDAVLLTRRSCDPLYRKSVRVSMGGVLRVPFAFVESAADAAAVLGEACFATVALTPGADAVDIGEAACGERVALFLGAEGPGLRDETIAACARRVRIPATDRVDSLNLAVAAGIALHCLAPLPLRSPP